MNVPNATVSPAAEWMLAHDALANLRQRRAKLDWEEGQALLRALRAGSHTHFGYASFAEYAERLLGCSRRTTEEKLRVANALEELPSLLQALETGELSWSAVRELTRVAVPQTEREWLEVARGKTVRQIEESVSGLTLGNSPRDSRRPELIRHVLHFEVNAETLATFREAMKEMRARSDSRLDDDALLLSMAREILGGPRDPGRASYQLVVTRCDACGRGSQHTNGAALDLHPDIVEMCECDAQRVPFVRASSSNLSDEARRAQLVDDARVGAGGDLGGTISKPAEPDGEPRRTQPVADAHVGGGSARPPGARAARSARATQDTPPAMRRHVVLRDRGCCVVPGCRNATYVDLHHLRPRAERGAHDPENLVLLCGAHHRALHRGRLQIDGNPSSGLVVRHGDGTPYDCVPSPLTADSAKRTFSALRNLGFRESTARSAVERTLASAADDATPATLLRAALAHATATH